MRANQWLRRLAIHSKAVTRGSRRGLLMEALEDRRLLAVTANFNSGALTVTGDGNANSISIISENQGGTDYLMVYNAASPIYDGTPTGHNVQASAVQSISVDAQGSDDSVDLSLVDVGHGFSGINSAVTLLGGAGNDVLTGSAYADSISGDDGYDTIIGGAGDDSMTGGAGGDRYVFSGTGLGSDTVVEADSSGEQDIMNLYTLASIDILDFNGITGSGITINAGSTATQFYIGGSSLTLSNDKGIDAVVGSDTDDSITGTSLMNLIWGDGGDDLIYGGDGIDRMAGGEGNDSMYGDAGNDTMSGEEGDDYLYDVSGSNELKGDDGITPYGGDDTLIAGAGTDIFVPGVGDDSVVGGSGNDLYLFYGSNLGSDTIDEAANSDRDFLIFYAVTGSREVAGTTIQSFGSSLVLDLSSTSPQSIATGTTLTFTSGTGIEAVIGSEYADQITGNSRDNYIDGGIGNDTISAGDGNDLIVGGSGDDSLVGGNGNDTYLYGDDGGSDYISEAANQDGDSLVFGFSSPVTIDLSNTASQQVTSLASGNTTIQLSSSTGIEIVGGTIYADSITGNSRRNILIGGAPVTEDGTSPGYEIGSDGADTLGGGDGDDLLISGTVFFGQDAMGLPNFPTALGNIYTEWNSGNSYPNRIANIQGAPGAPNPIDAGSQLVFGSAVLDPDGDADSLTGGNGSDWFLSDTRNDSTDASSETVTGIGLDQFSWDYASRELLVFGDTSANTYKMSTAVVSGVTYVVIKDAGNNIVWHGKNDTPVGQEARADEVVFVMVYGGAGNDTIDLSDATTANGFTALGSRLHYISGGAGADTIAGTGFADLVEGDSGNDSVTAGAGDDLVVGGTGDDYLAGGSGSDSYLFLGHDNLGSDSLIEDGGGSNDVADSLDFGGADWGTNAGITLDLSSTSPQTIRSGKLSLTLSSSSGFEHAAGTQYSDSITGNTRDNILFGIAGDDTISSGDGRDLVVGGDGADSLTGGNDDDILVSGDLFFEDTYGAVIAIIAEWTSGHSYSDRIANIRGTGPNPISASAQLIVSTTPSLTVGDFGADVDTLTGGAGSDWFLDDLGEDSNDNGGGETETDVGVL